MAIKLFTGIPGSGKTYRCVYELLKPEIKDKYFIIHNIPKLNELYFDGGEYIRSYADDKNELSYNPPALFFLENQKELTQRVQDQYHRPLLIVIDECQTWLDKYDERIKAWLSYHRHLGQDIWLVSQSRWNIHKDYKNLIELEIMGKRGFVFRSFLYSWFANGEHFKTDRLPKKKEIFKLYESFTIQSNDGKKSKLFYWMAGFILAAVIIGCFYTCQLRKNLNRIATKGKAKIITEQKKDILKNVTQNTAKYYFVGYVGSQAVVQDEIGRLYNADDILDGDYFVIDKKKSAVIYIDKNKGSEVVKRKRYIEKEAEASGGGKPARASTQEQGQERVKVVKIE